MGRRSHLHCVKRSIARSDDQVFDHRKSNADFARSAARPNSDVGKTTLAAQLGAAAPALVPESPSPLSEPGRALDSGATPEALTPSGTPRAEDNERPRAATEALASPDPSQGELDEAPTILVDVADTRPSKEEARNDPYSVAGPIVGPEANTRTLKLTFGTPQMRALGVNATVSLNFVKHSVNPDGSVNIVGKVTFGFSSAKAGISDRQGYSSKQPSIPEDGFLGSTTVSVGLNAQFARLQADILVGQLPKLFDNEAQSLDIANFAATYNVPLLHASGTVGLKVGFNEATRQISLKPSFSGSSTSISGVSADLTINGSFGMRVSPLVARALLTPFVDLSPSPEDRLPGGIGPALPPGR
jgi:hypothetical protein